MPLADSANDYKLSLARAILIRFAHGYFAYKDLCALFIRIIARKILLAVMT